MLDALFWQYADGDAGLLLENGVLRGTAASGIFAGIDLVSGVATQVYATPFVLKQMDLDPALSGEVAYAAVTRHARDCLVNTAGWHVQRAAPVTGCRYHRRCLWGHGQFDGRNQHPRGPERGHGDCRGIINTA